MKILKSIQVEGLADPVRAKFAMVVPVLEATLYSVSGERVQRLGGYQSWSLADLCREHRAGFGDTGICFEYAVHEAIAAQDPLIWPLASETLQEFCGIPDGAQSILFGPEKDGRLPILQTVRESLTNDSRIYVGNRGQPPKLRRYIPQIIRASRRNEERNNLPRSINGLWKADLFLGNPGREAWVGTTVKVNQQALEGAQGLRIGIYPKVNAADAPRKDEHLNLVRMPLPYDGAFMELFYKSFFLVKAFMNADGHVPPPPALPDAEDRLVTQELEARRDFPILEVCEVIREMSQQGLLTNEEVTDVPATASLSEESGLVADAEPVPPSDQVSLSPEPLA